MRNLARMAGLFILALLLGIFLAPRAQSLAQLTGSALRGQVQAVTLQMQSSMDAAAPDVAVHVATILLVLGAAIVASIVYLLVFLPLRIHSMQRELRSQREQIQAMKSEVHLSSELLLGARREYNLQERDRKVKEQEAAQPRLRQAWTPPRRDGHQDRDAKQL